MPQKQKLSLKEKAEIRQDYLKGTISMHIKGGKRGYASGDIAEDFRSCRLFNDGKCVQSH